MLATLGFIALVASPDSTAAETHTFYDCVDGGATKTYPAPLDVGECLAVTMNGDDRSDVDLQIDKARVEVDAGTCQPDEARAAACNRSHAGESYTITVKNLGPVANCFVIEFRFVHGDPA